MVVASPSPSAKSIVFSYHSSSTLTVPSSTSSHGIEYSRIPCDTTVVFSMPDSVKWNGKRSSRNQTQSYLSRVSTWNSNNGRPSVSPVYINTRLHQADLPLLTRLIQSSRNMKRKQQQGELTERSERSIIIRDNITGCLGLKNWSELLTFLFAYLI